MHENHEKRCLTFFAFLPPYIGVSGSLVARKRKSVKRSIDWYKKSKFHALRLGIRPFLCPLAEYRRITI